MTARTTEASTPAAATTPRPSGNAWQAIIMNKAYLKKGN